MNLYWPLNKTKWSLPYCLDMSEFDRNVRSTLRTQRGGATNWPWSISAEEGMCIPTTAFLHIYAQLTLQIYICKIYLPVQ